MELQLCYNASEDRFPLPPHINSSMARLGFRRVLIPSVRI
jgi:hypothetical protein